MASEHGVDREVPKTKSGRALRRIFGLALPPVWLVFYYLALVGMLYLFVELAERTYREGGLVFDHVLLSWLYQIQAPPLTRLALALDRVAISYTLGAVVLAVAALVWTRSRRTSIFLVLGFWGAVAFNLLAKEVFSRLRPDLFEQLTPITNTSFPSGHAMGSLAFALCITAAAVYLRSDTAWWVGLLSVGFALTVGVSRNYLQVHYPSDVLAGWALTAVWVLGLTRWYFHPRYVHSFFAPDETERMEEQIQEERIDEAEREEEAERAADASGPR